MRFATCPNCGTPFTKTKWKEGEPGEFECPQCGQWYNVDAVENEENPRHQESADLLTIPNLLNNLEFREAENRLEELERKYPDNPKVYFLKVLAANCITYIPDESSKGQEKWVPTLNNINSEPLSSLSSYKKCLELAKGEEKNRFVEVFDFIEKKRAEVLEDYQTGKYFYDVFISTKVSKLDFSNPANPVPVLDANGDAVQTEDAKLAAKIYHQLRHDNPKLRVFYSEQEKDQMVGQRFENVIFSALHSAKVFVLVASDINHINWRWVKNEWKRYLYLMDPSEEGYKNRHIILVGKGLAKTELPFELKKREFIDFERDEMGGPLNLLKFVNASLSLGENYEKLVAQTFDSSVATINQDAIQATQMQTTTLGASVQKVNIETEEEARYWIKQTHDDDRAARKDAFKDLKRFVDSHPEAYAARIHLLLEDTDYDDIGEYFSECENVYEKPEIAKEFFKLAEKEDAIKRLDSFAGVLTECVKAYAEQDLGQLVIAAEATVAPNLSYLEQGRLKSLFDAYKGRVEKLSRGFKDLSFLSQYFDLHLFYTKKDPKKYIAVREKLIYYFDDKKIIGWIADSIIKVDPGNVTVLWGQVTARLMNAVLTPDEFTRKIHFEEVALRSPLVGNKTILKLFNDLFLYAPQADKSKYLYAFLSALVIQDETYSYEGSDAHGDAGLSGYDLFKKYIRFDLSGLPNYGWTSNNLRFYYQGKPGNAFILKGIGKITPLDELLCRFAIGLHHRQQFNLAIDLYQTYLAQQPDINSIDCLMVRYYQKLAETGCVEPNEVAFSSQKFDSVSIGVALAKVDNDEYDDFRKFITHLERDRASYQATYESLKKVFTMRPKATFSALPSLKQAVKEFDRQFASLKERGTPDRIIDALKNDLSSELKTLNDEIQGLKEAQKKLSLVRKKDQEPASAVMELYNKARFQKIDSSASKPKKAEESHSSYFGNSSSNADPRYLNPRQFVIDELEEYVHLYEQWGDAAELIEAEKWKGQALESLSAYDARVKEEIRQDVATKTRARKKAARKARTKAFSTVFFLIVVPVLLCLGSLALQWFLGYMQDITRPLYEGERLFGWTVDCSQLMTVSGTCGTDESITTNLAYGHEGLLAIFDRLTFELGDIFFMKGEETFSFVSIGAFIATYAIILLASWLGYAGKSRLVAVFTFIAMAPIALYGLILILDGIITGFCWAWACPYVGGCWSFGWGGTPISWIGLGLAFVAASALTTSGSIALFATGRYDE